MIIRELTDSFSWRNGVKLTLILEGIQSVRRHVAFGNCIALVTLFHIYTIFNSSFQPRSVIHLSLRIEIMLFDSFSAFPLFPQLIFLSHLKFIFPLVALLFFLRVDFPRWHFVLMQREKVNLDWKGKNAGKLTQC